MLYNVDSAYASSFFALDKIRKQFNLEGINSINVNLSKAGLCSFGSSMYFVDDKELFVEAISGKKASSLINIPEFLANEVSANDDTVDYTNWQMGFGRRFDALKVYFVLQRFGVKGIQEYLNYVIDTSDYFLSLIEKSVFFDLFVIKKYSLTCFIPKVKPNLAKFGSLQERNEMIKRFVYELNKEGFIFLNNGLHAESNTQFIRFNIASYRQQKKILMKFLII